MEKRFRLNEQKSDYEVPTAAAAVEAAAAPAAETAVTAASHCDMILDAGGKFGSKLNQASQMYYRRANLFLKIYLQLSS